MVVKAQRIKGSYGMPEGADLLLGSFELEVDAKMDGNDFTCESFTPNSITTPRVWDALPET